VVEVPVTVASMSPDAALAALARSQGGLFHRDDAVRMGVDGRVLDRRVARDLLIERHPRVYQASTAPFGREEQERAALLAGGDDALLSHDNAGYRWKLVTIEPSVVWITLPWRKHSLHLEGVEVVRSRQTAGIRRVRDGWPLTSPSRTWVDLGRTQDVAALESALASGLQSKRLTLAEVAAQLSRSHNKAGTGVVRQVLPRFRPEWESRLAATFARMVAAAGIELEAGIELSDEEGIRVAVLDFGDRRRRIAFEVDGWWFHGSKEQQQRDRERDRRLLRRGWVTVRFTTDDILNRPHQVIAEVRALLASRTAA
jgi:very-short-patch-repair endonuclease